MITRRGIVLNGCAVGALAGVAQAVPLKAQTPEEIPLWPGKPPGEGGPSGPEKIGGPGKGYGAVSNISTPRLRVHRPNHPNGKAVIICGGGGYFRIQLWKESAPAARWLQNRGYTAFELIYRLPNDGWNVGAPFADAQRAMKIVRMRAAEFGIQPDRIGIMGMSAGGHLAGYTALQPTHAFYSGNDRYEQVSARPDFAALLFPVVVLRKPYDTTRTRRELVGSHPSRAAENAWSLDKLAHRGAPPTILFSASDDPIAPPGHNLALYQALHEAGAPAELHIFEKGGHGWGLGRPNEILSQWPEIFDAWITRRNFKQ
ncbi:alpha/beta hydrolase fold domain-containing protein [Porphyrobacter algicida]|uniref:Alpha/beta hydrolase fold domain-containing protein n=1 Tax=Qipengyuania algicida TaxID=1836209 RepID=A0A845AK86_9SPHN|nr:alpha/beta hydrolase [Qipengyuania algicida]MXP29563.1 alpha/beta hydrolase fold domain-containing protein [Qipengyuania algicida]